MGQDKTARTILEYTVDKQSLNQTEQATRRLKGEIAAIGSDIRSKFAAPSAELSRRLKENVKDVQQYTGALDKLEGQLKDTAREQQKLGKVDVGQGASKLAGLVGGVGGAAGAEPIRLIGDFAETLTTLGPLAAAGGIAIGGLNLVFGEMSRQSELARASVQRQLDTLRALLELQQTGTDADAKAQLEAFEQTKRAREAEKAILEELVSASDGSLEGIVQAELELRKFGLSFSGARNKIAEINTELPNLNINIAVLNKMLEEGAFKSADAEENVRGFFEGLSSAVGDAGQFIDKIAKGISDTLKKELAAQEAQKREIASIQQSYNDDLAKLETDALEKRADLAKSYNDKLVDLAQEAADGAAKALQNLLQEREQLATQLARDDATAQQQAQQDTLNTAIEFQREEERAARDHARNLRSIRDKAADSELKQIADRDFQSLFFSRRQTARELTAAGQTFLEERQERAIAANQAAQDRAAQFAFEREQRLAQYQQNIADAEKAYRIEQAQITTNLAKQRQAANVAYQQSLTDLNIALTSQLKLRRDGYVAELQLASKSAEERLKLEQQIQNALVRQAQNTLAALGGGGTGGTGSGTRRRAFGGNLNAGESSLVNERGIESFAAGGQKSSFPSGLGIFTALKSGNVNPRGGGAGGNLYVSISGSNPDGIWRTLEPKLNNWAKQIFGV